MSSTEIKWGTTVRTATRMRLRSFPAQKIASAHQPTGITTFTTFAKKTCSKTSESIADVYRLKSLRKAATNSAEQASFRQFLPTVTLMALPG